MINFKNVVSFISLITFFVFGWWILFYSAITSKRKSLYGEVLIVWKTMPPRSKWIVEVKELESIETINFQFIDNVITIHKGDSLKKAKGSEHFYIKRNKDSTWDSIKETGFVE